ncbi:hypothetical protein OS493_015904 [Desmophyllum pertusum]|uniref:Uncharacterized protein n=1 Tax=Desmophyllum pertusum TaxID=174260 RepID=A0A9W9YEE4_9CNID|nr:hypothetical protein OS493_015904 [Desmophyllum pertusum]
MRVHAEDDISFVAGYRHLNDLRHDSAWIMSCVLYAHSAICLVVVVAFASYGLVWPIRDKSETLLHKTTRKGTVNTTLRHPGNVTNVQVNLHFVITSYRSTVAAKPV